MNAMRYLLLAIALFVFAGCVQTPIQTSQQKAAKPRVQKAKVVKPDLPVVPVGKGAMVYVVRPNKGAKAVSFDVYIDGKEKSNFLGSTDTEQYLYAHLPAGKHTIYSKAEKWAALKVNLSPREVVFIEQKSKRGFLFARNEISIIDKKTGTGHVKKLKVGTFNK